MFFVFWGTKSRTDRHGIVGDLCGRCRSIKVFTVDDYYKVPHLYYISLGKGTFVGTIRTCWDCGGQFYCELESYDGFLNDSEGETLSMADILRRTNSRLVKVLESQNLDEQ